MSHAARARPPRVLGAVLAGGASSRFGSPKWKAELAGLSMGARAVAALQPHAVRVVALSAETEASALGVEVRPDLEPGLGPLGAIRTALIWAGELSLDAVFVLACDMPLVGPELVGAMIDAWTGEDAVAPYGPSGPEPLCALYTPAFLPSVTRALRRGHLSPSQLLGRARLRRFSIEDARAVARVDDPFLNVNTREAHALAEAVLSRRVAE